MPKDSSTGTRLQSAACPDDKQAHLVRRLKGIEKDAETNLRLPVFDRSERIVGYLAPIGTMLAKDNLLAEDLTQWRRANANMFLSSFDLSAARTQRWLNETVITDDSKLLFLVTDAQGRRLGQYGLRDIGPDSAELDNGIRGEAGGHPHLFFYVELAVMSFCFGQLNVKRVITRAFSDNYLALRLHNMVGLTIDGNEPLVSVIENGEIRYAVQTDENNIESARSMTVLSMERAAFYRKYGWIAATKHTH